MWMQSMSIPMQEVLSSLAGHSDDSSEQMAIEDTQVPEHPQQQASAAPSSATAHTFGGHAQQQSIKQEDPRSKAEPQTSQSSPPAVPEPPSQHPHQVQAQCTGQVTAVEQKSNQAKPDGQLQVGAIVRTLFEVENERAWYQGRILKANANNTYSVQYSDGEQFHDIPRVKFILIKDQHEIERLNAALRAKAKKAKAKASQQQQATAEDYMNDVGDSKEDGGCTIM